jgi:hypothetical protein
VRRAALAGVAAAAAARIAYAALRRYPPATEQTWLRTNHRGEPVTLLAGPAVALGAVAAHVAAHAAVRGPAAGLPAMGRGASRPVVTGPVVTGPVVVSPMVISAVGGLGFGLLDDLAGSAKRKGLRGHIGALAHGEITTGAVKLAGLALTGLIAAAAADRPPSVGPAARPAAGRVAGTGGSGGTRGSGSIADLAVNAGLIAGGANLLNLFDLRPGRALKVAALSAGLIAACGARRGGLDAVAAPAAAALALLPEDLGERAMLGDAGANAVGAMLGAAAAQTLPRSARTGLLAAIVALTVASEKVSFTKVIERTPALRWADMLGRRPAPLAAPVPDPPSRDTASGGTGTGSGTGTGTGTDGLSPDAPGFAPPPRRLAGRHRRTVTGASRTRSASLYFDFLSRPARQEP